MDRCDPFPCSRFPLVKFGDVVVSGEQSRGVITVITPPHAPGQKQVTVQMGQAGDPRALYTMYSTLDDLRASFPNLPDGKYRIEVVSLDVPFLHALYALASVTNNRTQLVTAIASH